MRRLLFSVLALAMLGLSVGCNHTMGVCDCDCGGPCGTAPHHGDGVHWGDHVEPPIADH